jgi:uncharacterized protein (DUF849 family)
MSALEDKVIILVAPNGERTSGEGGIYVPYTPKEIAEDAFRCYQAGASIVHVHGRDEKTTFLSADKRVFNETFRRIRDKCDMLIEMTGNMGPLYNPDKGMGSMLRRTKDDFIIGDRSQTRHGPYHRGYDGDDGSCRSLGYFRESTRFSEKIYSGCN